MANHDFEIFPQSSHRYCDILVTHTHIGRNLIIPELHN